MGLDLTPGFLDTAVLVAGVLLSCATALVVARLALGPTLPDRALALDLLGFIAVGFVALVVVSTGEGTLFDPAMALALMAFLATLALARFSARSAHAEGGGTGETDETRGPSLESPTPEGPRRRPVGDTDA